MHHRANRSADIAPDSGAGSTLPSFIQSLRPFSLVVALVSCGLGVVLALLQQHGDGARAVLILSAGLLLQGGVNLINDHSDLPLLEGKRYRQLRMVIRQQCRWGYLAIALSALLGIGLVVDVGWSLLLLLLLGLLGALGYTVEPLNYKRRGLGVPLVFWLMGVLMIVGAYHAMGAPLSADVFWLSLPVSMLVALLLLSNELRDWEADRRNNIQTLSVRIGYSAASRLYLLMLSVTYLLCLLLWQQGLLIRLWPLLLSLPLLPELLSLLSKSASQRVSLTPKSGRLLLIFGVLFVGCVVP
ncbi:MAG: prenyltransferase [Motiliproteus sp.]